MEHKVFNASKRVETGKGAAGRIRRSGRIPAIVYGHGEPMAITIDEREYLKEHAAITESTMVNLKIDGASHDAFVKESQSDIVSGKVLHVDFYEVEKGHAVRLNVSIVLSGTAEGVRAGGIMENPTHHVEVECDPSLMPEKIEVDISSLGVNQSIHAKDLKLPKAAKLISSPDTVIVLVKYAKAEAATETAEAAPAAAAPAAGAAGAAAQGAEAAKS